MKSFGGKTIDDPGKVARLVMDFVGYPPSSGNAAPETLLVSAAVKMLDRSQTGWVPKK